MSAPYDVVIVGGRVAGASTALLLARSGARVALVDRSRYGSDTVSTHALMRAGVMQLSRWGLLDEVVAAGTPPIRRTRFHYADGETVQVSIRPGAWVDALYAPRRHVLDRILVDAAAEAGADVLHRTSVTELLRDRTGGVRGVRARDRAGGVIELPAAVTVGADGIRSVVAAQVGVRTLRQGTSAGAVLYRYYSGVPAPGYEWAYGAGCAAGFIPTSGDLTCVFVATTSARMRGLREAGTDEAFDTLLRAAGPAMVDRVSAAGLVGSTHGWGGVPGFVRQSWGRGWTLVGDAGYFKDPITTHGMTDALRDAELLADAILDGLSGVVPGPVALAGYQATRDRMSGGLFDATEVVAAYKWDLGEVRALLRRVSSAMADEVDLIQSLPPRADPGHADKVWARR